MSNIEECLRSNADFLKAIALSFKSFVEIGTSRSTDKLKPLHGAVAEDLSRMLGGGYTIFSQGYRTDKERRVRGRYYDKMVDITAVDNSNGKPVCCIGVKFIMQNYSQNSNNYFEGMLGETANIRCENCPYFHIFVILDKLPYYKRDKTISKWETFSQHNAGKYLVLSQDDVTQFFHTPNKVLICVVHVPDNENIHTEDEYMTFYRNLSTLDVVVSKNTFDDFGDVVILNDYRRFMTKIYHAVLAR